MRYLLVLLAASTLLGQQNPLTVTASAPQAIQGVNLNYSGSLGQSEVCYWVVVTYPIGNVPPPSPTCLFAGQAITSGNSITVQWNSMQGATSYTVLRTTVESLPANCTNCLLISNTTGTSFTDIGNSLPSYLLTNIPSPVSEFEQLDNRNYPTPEFLIYPYPLRIGTSIIFPDGTVQTTASGTGTITTVNGTSPITVNQVGNTATVACTICVTGTPSANSIQVGNGTQTLQSRPATEDTSGNLATPGSLMTGVGGAPGEITWGPFLFVGLPAVAPGTADGSLVYCSDCAATNPCTGSGTGAFAERLNGAWNCSSGGDLTATYILKTADASLPNAQALGALGSGCLSVTTGTGVVASSGSACGTGSGTVTNVTGSAPIASSGGPTPAISCSTCITATPTNHDVAVFSLTQALTAVPPGTSGFVLTSNGPSSDPSFQATSSGGLSCSNYTITQSPFGTTWTVTGQSGQGVTGSTTTQTINIVTLASKTVINALRIATGTGWAGTSMTNITMSLGTNASGGSTTSFEPAFVVGGTANTITAHSPFGACTAACPAYLDDGGSFSGADNGETVTATFISTGGNLTAMTAGSEVITLCTTVLP